MRGARGFVLVNALVLVGALAAAAVVLAAVAVAFMAGIAADRWLDGPMGLWLALAGAAMGAWAVGLASGRLDR